MVAVNAVVKNSHKNEDWVEIPLLTTGNVAALGDGPRGTGEAF